MRVVFLSCSTLLLASFALGCEEPVPPIPQGAFLVNFVDTGADCPHKNHQSLLGDVNATERKSFLLDGAPGASVDCTVSGAALGPFSIEANLGFEGTEALTISVDQIDAKATEAAPAKGSVGFSSSVTGNFFGAGEPCDFYIEPAGPSGDGQGVKPGEAWLSFKCPSMVNSMYTCALNESYVLIENCAQQ